MIVPVMAISNLVLTRQFYSEETNGARAHYREPVPLTRSPLTAALYYLKAWNVKRLMLARCSIMVLCFGIVEIRDNLIPHMKLT